MIYLLDTDTLIALARGFKAGAKPRRSVERARRMRERSRQIQREGHEIGLSSMNVAELEYGARCSGRYVEEMSAIHRVLRPFKLYPWDPVHGPWHYGKIRFELESMGLTIGNMDLLIAAHALGLHAKLVTNNLAHFERVAGLELENWS